MAQQVENLPAMPETWFQSLGWEDYCETEWIALETNQDHFVVFETASKCCISDSFVDCEGYSISSKGFMPIVVDIMVV